MDTPAPAVDHRRTTRAVVATLLPFLKPYRGRIALALAQCQQLFEMVG